MPCVLCNKDHINIVGGICVALFSLASLFFPLSTGTSADDLQFVLKAVDKTASCS